MCGGEKMRQSFEGYLQTSKPKFNIHLYTSRDPSVGSTALVRRLTWSDKREYVNFDHKRDHW